MNDKLGRYTLAYDTKKRITSIDDARRKAPYVCAGCKGPMIPKMGGKRRHYFAHKTGAVCASGNALHEASKAYIIRQFEDAIRAKQDYGVDIPCMLCRQQVSRYSLTAAGGAASIRPDMSAIKGMPRSDLVIFGHAQYGSAVPYAIIEIVTDEPDPDIYTAYQRSGIPIITVCPSWARPSRVDRTMNLACGVCKKCRIRADDLKQFRFDITREVGAPPREITPGQLGGGGSGSGGGIPTTTMREVNKIARSLSGCGFVQQPSRPTLFQCASTDWQVYVNLNPMEFGEPPGLYVWSNQRERDERECHPDCCECVREAAVQRLLQVGINTKRYLLDIIPNHWHEPDTYHQCFLGEGPNEHG